MLLYFVLSLVEEDYTEVILPFLMYKTSRTCINVIVLDDSIPEVEEEFKIHLLTVYPGSNVIVNSVTARIVIMDDDGKLLNSV